MKKPCLVVKLRILQGPLAPAWRHLWERLLEENEARPHEGDEQTEEWMNSDVKGKTRRF